jgi:hypothetical protein
MVDVIKPADVKPAVQPAAGDGQVAKTPQENVAQTQTTATSALQAAAGIWKKAESLAGDVTQTAEHDWAALFSSNPDNFKKTATTITNDAFATLNTTDAKTIGGSPNKAADQAFAKEAAQAADIKGIFPGTAGGVTVTEKGEKGSSKVDKVEATGTNKDGAKVDAVVTKAGEMVKAGDITYTHPKTGGTQVADKDFQITNHDGVVTVNDPKDGRHVVFDQKTHSYTVVDDKNGESTTYNEKGATTRLGKHKVVTQTSGSALAAADAAKTDGTGDGSTTRFFQDPQGDMAAIKGDGTMFKYNVKDQNLEISQGTTTVKRNMQNGTVSVYENGQLVEHPDSANLPKGWQVQKDGTITINGQQVVGSQASGSDAVQIEAGSTFHTNKKVLEAQTENGKSKVTSNAAGTATDLTGAAPHVEVNTNGQMTETTAAGKTPVTFNAQTNEMKVQGPNGESVDLNGKDGSATLFDPKNQQRTLINGDGSVQSGTVGSNGQYDSLFNADSSGNIGLFDNTTISDNGQIWNSDGSLVGSGWSDDSSTSTGDGTGDGTGGGDGSGTSGNGNIITGDGTLDPSTTPVGAMPNGFVIEANGTVVGPDGTIYADRGAAMEAENQLRKEDGGTKLAATDHHVKTEKDVRASIVKVSDEDGGNIKPAFAAVRDAQTGQPSLNPLDKAQTLQTADTSLAQVAGKQGINPYVQEFASHMKDDVDRALDQTNMAFLFPGAGGTNQQQQAQQQDLALTA